jgi:hypothetical protein
MEPAGAAEPEFRRTDNRRLGGKPGQAEFDAVAPASRSGHPVRPRRSEAKRLVERVNRYLETSFRGIGDPLIGLRDEWQA